MEQNFQTSFIPKKSIVKERAISAHSISFVTIISLFIFLAMVVGTGVLYFYKGVLDKDISGIENTLGLAQNRFEPSKISELQDLDNRLIAASDILSKHISVTPIFEALQKVTMKTVRFTSFHYSLPTEASGKVMVKLSGVGIGYKSVALQADLFSQNQNFIDPIFSNLQLDDKGNVNFDLDFAVDPSFVNYKQNILTREQGN